MSEIDGQKREPIRPKEADQSGDAGRLKDKSVNQFSWSEIVSQQNSKSRSDSRSNEHQIKTPTHSKDRSVGHSNFEALFGITLLRAIDPKMADREHVREFRWFSAAADFRQIAKQWGRKFIQPGKVETKDFKQRNETGEHQHLPGLKETSRTGKPESEKSLAASKHAGDDDKNAREDQPLPEDTAIDLDVETIYDEDDYREEIKRATELALGIDEAHTKGVQVFKNLEQLHPQDTGSAGQAVIADHLSKKRLRQCIAKMKGGKVVVVGDLLIDELLEGSPERISREAPVLILEHVCTELIPGGAANTAHNIASLGGICHAIGVCGKDENADRLAALLEKHHITHSLVQDPHRPTTVKTRIMSRSHAIRQQLLRLDRISHATIDSAIETLLVDRIDRVAAQYNAIILSDYRAGVINDGVIKACRKASLRHNLTLVVDAQESFERFQEATLLTPNQPDAEKAVGFTFDTPEKLKQGGEELLLITGAHSLLITLGPGGMMLFIKGQAPFHLPVFNRSDVFDVTGAGDTVVATMTLALVTGSTLHEAMALGNLAAGIVVRKSGTAVTNQQELEANLDLIAIPEE